MNALPADLLGHDHDEMGTHDPAVDAWFSVYDNPQKDLVMAIRDAILDADPG